MNVCYLQYNAEAYALDDATGARRGRGQLRGVRALQGGAAGGGGRREGAAESESRAPQGRQAAESAGGFCEL